MPGQRRATRSATKEDAPEWTSQSVTSTVDAGPMSRAVAEALETAPVLPRDAAAAELARQYAALIDAAEPSAVYVRHLRALNGALIGADESAKEAYHKISEALAAHSVASDLGPKLLAVLTSLGMTAAGRSAKGGAPDGPKVDDELAELRARAQQRRSR